MTSENKSTLHTSMRRNIRAALAVIVFLLGGIVVWATTTQISGAVIAAGSVVVEFECQEGAAPDGWDSDRGACAQR